MKKATIGKAVVVILAGIILLIAAGITAGVIWVRSFIPAGHFEGTWQGTITFETPKADPLGKYASLDGRSLDLTLEIDEQSRTYGHIRLSTNNVLVLTDEIFTSRFGPKNRILPGDDFFKLEGEVYSADDRSILEGTFIYKGFDGEIELTGTIRVYLVSREVKIFEDRYVPR